MEPWTFFQRYHYLLILLAVPNPFLALIVIAEISFFHFSLSLISGPDLPIPLSYHSMVPLGRGQAILGGSDENSYSQSKIYHMTCSNQFCNIISWTKELSVSRFGFVAIPIPDSISECVSDSKLKRLVLFTVLEI